jgi:serine phosphatase RsbU (regulator of sigma subunit)
VVRQGSLTPSGTGMEPVNRPRARTVLEVMPFLIMGAVTVAALVLGDGNGVLPLLSLGPAFAALTGGFRHTLIIAAVAVALCAALSIYENLVATQEDILAFATVVGVTVAAVIASAVRQRQEHELADVTAIAEVTQRVLLRPVPDRAGPLRLAVRYVSAASRAQIGGDLYEVASTGRYLRLIIGDVQGKGLPSVQAAATVLGTFREAAYDTATLPAVAERIERGLARQESAEQFVTAFLAEISADGHQLTLLNCGHPPPLMMSTEGGRLLDIAEPGLPLGLSSLATGPRIPATTHVKPGDCVLFYTDGLSEARDRTGTFFPLADWRGMERCHDLDQMLDRLCGDVIRHVGHNLEDDAAMLLLRHEPG